MYDCSQDIQEGHRSTVNSRLYRKKITSRRKNIFDGEIRNRDATRRDSSRIRLARIRDALGSTPLRKKDPQERKSRSITPVPLSLLLSSSSSSPFLSVSLYRPPKITRVRLAPVASMTKVGRPGLWASTRFEQPAPEAATFVFI